MGNPGEAPRTLQSALGRAKALNLVHLELEARLDLARIK